MLSSSTDLTAAEQRAVITRVTRRLISFAFIYCLFEIPSNLILERAGARRWMAPIMIGWGVVSMAMMFITNTATFYAARVLLAIAEAGFFPGMVLYLTYWIPASERARTNALFMMAAADRHHRRRAGCWS